MDLLYRLFYTIFSMSVIIAVIVPVVLVLRLLLAKAPKICIVYLWLLVFFRGICPVALSSTFSIVKAWNRKFHVLLSQTGLEVAGSTGIMKGWTNVFTNDISVNRSYMACTYIWCAGMAGLCIILFVHRRKSKGVIKDAVHIYDRVYQSKGLESPVITGIFVLKQYLPADIKVNDIKYLLQHFEAHRKRKDGIKRFLASLVVIVHWFNPLIWVAYHFLSVDIEMAADEMVVKNNGQASANGYAQEIFNLKEISNKGILSPCFSGERYLQPRVYRLLHIQQGNKGYVCLALLMLFLCFAWIFLLRPLQILWAGGTWGIEYETGTDSSLFNDKEDIVVASLDTTSPSGFGRTLQLVMTSGTYDNSSGYTGDFIIRLSDGYDPEIAKAELNYYFNDIKDGNMHFGEGTKLYAYDYNGDGTNEIVIGQQVEVSGSRWKEITGSKRKGNGFLNEYYIWNIEETSLKKVSDAIYDTSGKEPASCQFDIPEMTTRVFITELQGKKMYYVWNTGQERYQQMELEEDDIKKYRTDYNGPASGDGEKNSHTLESNGTALIEIKTQKDASGSEVIKEIILNPGTSSRKMKTAEGYFCDIKWVMAADGITGRYAVLIYNGLKAQTFIIYDLEEQDVYYSHEDGNNILNETYKKYNGNDARFNEESPTVYTLMEKDGDTLKIGFAASSNDGAAVNGSYVYNTVTKNISNFSYMQDKN